MNKWISVKERLPEQLISVLVFMPEVKSCKIISAYLRTFEDINPKYEPWWYTELNRDHITAKITHWMPLPTAPGENS